MKNTLNQTKVRLNDIIKLILNDDDYFIDFLALLILHMI